MLNTPAIKLVNSWWTHVLNSVVVSMIYTFMATLSVVYLAQKAVDEVDLAAGLPFALAVTAARAVIEEVFRK